ncbi:MAG TPA: hypothetical protein VFY54_18415 [Rubrobacter sp.]|nr:hypothetical protein [Rubrobacter sp.]
MNYMEFNPDLYQERRQQVLGEVDSLRLHKRLRDKGASRSSNFFALARRCALPLLRSRNRGGASKVAPSPIGEDAR